MIIDRVGKDNISGKCNHEITRALWNNICESRTNAKS